MYKSQQSILKVMVNIIGNLRYTDHSNAKMGPTQLCKSNMSLDGQKGLRIQVTF